MYVRGCGRVCSGLQTAASRLPPRIIMSRAAHPAMAKKRCCTSPPPGKLCETPAMSGPSTEPRRPAAEASCPTAPARGHVRACEQWSGPRSAGRGIEGSRDRGIEGSRGRGIEGSRDRGIEALGWRTAGELLGWHVTREVGGAHAAQRDGRREQRPRQREDYWVRAQPGEHDCGERRNQCHPDVDMALAVSLGPHTERHG